MEGPVPLPRDFFLPSAEVVAPKLLGKLLIRRLPKGVCGGVIVETEAYLCGDPACHAVNGKTERNAAMFGPPGHAYVYFIYGCHYCVNVVCHPAGSGEAVLIRAAQPVFGLEHMQARRHVRKLVELTNGPAKLCQAMGIGLDLNHVDLCDAGAGLWIGRSEGLASGLNLGRIRSGPRIGITKARDLPLRFYYDAASHVSRS